MQTKKIDDIMVIERQRRNLGDIEGLADSISRVGLIHPIVIDDRGILLAGERRLNACRMLGMTEVSVRVFRDLSEIEKKEIELEENIRRKGLEWVEEVIAKRELDDLKRKVIGIEMDENYFNILKERFK